MTIGEFARLKQLLLVERSQLFPASLSRMAMLYGYFTENKDKWDLRLLVDWPRSTNK
jgi:hypothetical protein